MACSCNSRKWVVTRPDGTQVREIPTQIEASSLARRIDGSTYGVQVPSNH